MNAFTVCLLLTSWNIKFDVGKLDSFLKKLEPTEENIFEEVVFIHSDIIHDFISESIWEMFDKDTSDLPNRVYDNIDREQYYEDVYYGFSFAELLGYSLEKELGDWYVFCK